MELIPTTCIGPDLDPEEIPIDDVDELEEIAEDEDAAPENARI